MRFWLVLLLAIGLLISAIGTIVAWQHMSDRQSQRLASNNPLTVQPVVAQEVKQVAPVSTLRKDAASIEPGICSITVQRPGRITTVATIAELNELWELDGPLIEQLLIDKNCRRGDLLSVSFIFSVQRYIEPHLALALLDFPYADTYAMQFCDQSLPIRTTHIAFGCTYLGSRRSQR